MLFDAFISVKGGWSELVCYSYEDGKSMAPTQPVIQFLSESSIILFLTVSTYIYIYIYCGISPSDHKMEGIRGVKPAISDQIIIVRFSTDKPVGNSRGIAI